MFLIVSLNLFRYKVRARHGDSSVSWRRFWPGMNIEVDCLTFGYEEHRRVLNGISFTVADGQVLGVLGSSGCGKSTLLRIICGIISKESNSLLQGEVRFDKGVNLVELRANGGIGMMFQEPSLLPNLTVEE